MITTDLTTLKINKLTKAQYEAALAAGTINENELYMTPESEAESGGVFIINLTSSTAEDGITTVSSDKTYSEIKSAYNEGKACFLRNGELVFSLVFCDIPIYFSTVFENTVHVLKLTASDGIEEWSHFSYTISQSNWNVNDETSSEYVKNRPFYTGDPVETYIVQNASFSRSTDYGDTTKAYVFSSPIELTVGLKYTVYFNSTSYECVCISVDGTFTLGNISIAGGSNDTGEPFLIISDNSTQTGMYTTYTSDTPSVSISAIVPEIVKIDEKYIPELDYLSKTNPTGTGSFSLNREADTTIGDYSFAEGHNTTASGNFSHSEGNYTTASGGSSHAECSQTTASGSNSHAEGYNTTASGNSSHAEGNYTTASGDNSHAEGTTTTASGYSSHAEGQFTTASSDYSHAEGNNTKASSLYQHVQGKYNIEDSSRTYADIIGNGASDAKRSNASTVDWSGNAWFAGNVYVGSTSGTNKDSGSKKLATEDYVSSLKPAITATTLLASSWDSTAKTYSFESTYPNASYDIEVDIDGDRCTDEQLDAWIAAKPLSSSTNKIVAKGDIPTVDIPIILTITPK